MTEVSEVLPSLHDRIRRSQRDYEVAALAESIFVRLVTQSGDPLVRPANQLEVAARALRAARAFYQASDEWFSTQAAAAAAEAGVCDDRR